MNTTNKLLLSATLFTAGMVYLNADLSKQPSVEQLLKTEMPVYFDGLDIFNRASEVQDAKKNLESQFQEEGKNLQKLRADYEKTVVDLQNMGSVATEQARRKKQEEVLEKENKVAVKERSLQQYAQQETQRAEFEMASKLKDYATKVAKEKGYRMVLAGGVAYADDNLNISDSIVAKWNSDYDNKKSKTVAPQAVKTT